MKMRLIIPLILVLSIFILSCEDTGLTIDDIGKYNIQQQEQCWSKSTLFFNCTDAAGNENNTNIDVYIDSGSPSAGTLSNNGTSDSGNSSVVQWSIRYYDNTMLSHITAQNNNTGTLTAYNMNVNDTTFLYNVTMTDINIGDYICANFTANDTFNQLTVTQHQTNSCFTYNPSSACTPPDSGTWTLTQNCEMSTSYEKSIIVYIPNTYVLTIPSPYYFLADRFIIESGGKLVGEFRTQ